MFKLITVIIAICFIVMFWGHFYFFKKINYRAMPQGLCQGLLNNNKKNWVSSLVTPQSPNYIKPLRFSSLKDLHACIQHHCPETVITLINERKLVAYRQSYFFKFTDWLCIDNQGDVSASATMGYYDFGKNRLWIEKIRRYFQIKKT